MRELPTYSLRRAIEADQPIIRRMVRAEWLNPRDVHWQNFLVAEDETEKRIIGIGQIRMHGALKELGSLIILPEYRGLGLGAALIEALEARAGFPLYLMCAGNKVPYYRRFGYEALEDRDIPPVILPRWVLWIIRHVFRGRVAVMRKDD